MSNKQAEIQYKPNGGEKGKKLHIALYFHIPKLQNVTDFNKRLHWQSSSWGPISYMW